MTWQITWQDPVALLIVALTLVLTRWLRRRRPQGCGACARTRVTAAPIIPARRLVRRAG